MAVQRKSCGEYDYCFLGTWDGFVIRVDAFLVPSFDLQRDLPDGMLPKTL